FIIHLHHEPTLPAAVGTPDIEHGAPRTRKKPCRLESESARLSVHRWSGVPWRGHALFARGHRLRFLAHLDLDRLGLCLFALGQSHSEHPVLILGGHVVRLDGARKRERTRKRSVGALPPVVIPLFHFALHAALALEVQGVVLNTDFDLIGVYARQLSLHHQVLIGFVNVNRRRPRSGTEISPLAEHGGESLIEQPVESLLGRNQVMEWFPTYDRHN